MDWAHEWMSSGRIIGPSMFIDFKEDQLDPRITFTRASSGTYWDAAGVLQTASTDVARLTHDPATGESLGLLIEPAATNLLTYSQDFGNVIWIKNNSKGAAPVVTPNTIVAPDGTTTADEIAFDAGFVAGTLNGVYQYITVFSGARTGSIFLKVPSGTAQIYITTQDDGATHGNTLCNLTTEWQRFDVTVSTASVTKQSMLIGWYTTAGTPAGPVAPLTVHAWQAQLETGTVATSPIPTVASQVTRAVSIPSMTGSNFSSWYNAAKGTFLVNARAGGGADEFLFSAGEAGVSEIAVYRKNSDNDVYMRVIAASVSQVDVSLGDYPASGDCKVAIAYTATGISGCVNGGTVVASGAITVPTVASLYIGERSDASGVLNGTEKALTFYPETFSAATLQALTGA